MYTVTERLAHTRDGRLVPYDSVDAAFLAYSEGQVISAEEAVAAGLVDGGSVDAPEDAPEPETAAEAPEVDAESTEGDAAEAKQIIAPENRMVKAPHNKGAKHSKYQFKKR